MRFLNSNRDVQDVIVHYSPCGFLLRLFSVDGQVFTFSTPPLNPNRGMHLADRDNLLYILQFTMKGRHEVKLSSG